MKTIEQVYFIDVPRAKVWSGLVDPVKINAWVGGPDVEMSDHEGAEFRLWGGDIHGTNTKVIPNTLLTQSWYSEGFERASEVTFALDDDNGQTRLKLVHRRVPDDREDDIAMGWGEYYLGPLKEMCEKSI
jgi:activator of HSP90 ATPase